MDTPPKKDWSKHFLTDCFSALDPILDLPHDSLWECHLAHTTQIFIRLIVL